MNPTREPKGKITQFQTDSLIKMVIGIGLANLCIYSDQASLSLARETSDGDMISTKKKSVDQNSLHVSRQDTLWLMKFIMKVPVIMLRFGDALQLFLIFNSA